MALDEALLYSVAGGDSLPVLHFYRWQPATVTIGYAQSVATDLDLAVCRNAGLDVVRRSTGGRAVLHDHEVTYAVIAPLNSTLFGNSVLDCYRVIAEILQKTLVSFGLPAELVPGKGRGGAQNAAKAVCFSAPSQYELVVDGRKVAGSSQKRHGQAFLQHGSVPLEMDLELLGMALNARDNAAVVASLQTVGWLHRYLTSPLCVAEVEQRIADNFSATLQVEWQPSAPTPAELEMADKLCREMFGNPDWNLKR